MVKSTKLISNKRMLLTLLAIIVAVGALYLFVFRDGAKFTTTPSTSQKEDTRAAEEGRSQKNPNSAPAASANKQSGGVAVANADVSRPEGNFVSSHRINSRSDTVESVCTTTPGAACEITFKLGNDTKSLGKKTTNQSGTASWVWTPASVGLYAGSWEITAIATLGGSQNTAKDPLNLELAQ